MYKTVNDFLVVWKEEEGLTTKLFSNINEESKSRKVHENVRTLERLAWHITQTLTEMPTKAGIIQNDPLEHQKTPSSIAEIIELYKKYSTFLIQKIKANLSENDLGRIVPMYGDEWKISKVLHVLIVHQVHHRSQMTVIMRMLGLPVPGLYGPSKEEWSMFGMMPME